MLTTHTLSLPKRYNSLSFWVVGLALCAGLILSVLSWIELCVEHCSANQDYRLFHLPFAPVGIAYFVVAILLHSLSKRYTIFSLFIGWMIAAGLGAEVMFIAIQKYQIGQWCPLCLSIALCLALAGGFLGLGYAQTLYLTIQQSNRGAIMNKLKQGITSVSFFVLGFIIAFLGVSKIDPIQAEVNSIKERIAFGNKTSPVEMYFVTDWFCPSCQQVEKQIEQLLPQIKSKVTFYFIDYPIHTKSLNFSPYNLMFLLNNKNQYIEARHLLANLANVNENPKDNDVESAAKKAGIPYKEITYLEVKSGMDYFDSIVQKYDLKYTPTIIILNTRTNKMEKFEGTDEISEDKILKAIDKLS